MDKAKIERCSVCGIPRTHPTMFWEGDLCGACVNFAKRKEINWCERKLMFERLCDEFRRDDGSYDCLIAVSGGKDSHFLVKTMEEMGFNPLLCTVTDSFRHTYAGIHNLENLVNRHEHIQYKTHNGLFKRASRYCFEEIGTPLKFTEIAIYTIPYWLAKTLGISLVIFGENAAYEYGGVRENFYAANKYIYTLVQYAIADMDWWKRGGVSKRELGGILPHVFNWPVCVYLSYFFPWSSTENLKVAEDMGFWSLEDTGEWIREGCAEQFEQIDSYGYVAHLWMRYPRMGFQRTTDIVTRRVREGQMTLEQALDIINEKDHILDTAARKDFCKTLGYGELEFWAIVEQAKWNKHLGDKITNAYLNI